MSKRMTKAGSGRRRHPAGSRALAAASDPGSGARATSLSQRDATALVAGEAVQMPNPEAEDSCRDAAALDAIIERFRSNFPDAWDRLRLCPLQHGVETIRELLKTKRAAA